MIRFLILIQSRLRNCFRILRGIRSEDLCAASDVECDAVHGGSDNGEAVGDGRLDRDGSVGRKHSPDLSSAGRDAKAGRTRRTDLSGADGVDAVEDDDVRTGSDDAQDILARGVHLEAKNVHYKSSAQRLINSQYGNDCAKATNADRAPMITNTFILANYSRALSRMFEVDQLNGFEMML